MSDSQVTYEEVPIDDLKDHQIFHLNRKANDDIDPKQGAVIAEAVGLPMMYGKDVLQGTKGIAGNLAGAAFDAIRNKANPPAPATPPSVPPTEGSITPSGAGGWNQQLTGNTAPGSQMSKPWLDLNRRMAETVGPGGELAGGSIYKNSILLPPGAQTPSATPTPAPSTPAEVPPLSPYEKALQTVKSFGAENPVVQGARAVMNSPYAKAVGTGAGLWGAGENAMRLYNHLKHDQIGRELLDAAGVVSNAAMLAPTPFSPESNIAGALASIPISWYQNKLEKEDKVEKKAAGGQIAIKTGGLVALKKK